MSSTTNWSFPAGSLNPASEVFAYYRGKICLVSGGNPPLAAQSLHPPPVNSRIVVADRAGRWGYTTKDGVCFFPVQYEHTLETLATYAGIRLSRSRFFLDIYGQAHPLLTVANHPEWDERNFLTAHRESDAWVLRQSNGMLASRFHDVQSYFHDHRTLVKTSQGWRFLDISGNTIWAPPCAQADHYKEHRVRFLKQNKWGYADLNGTIVINPRFDSARNFSKGLAAVESNGRWLYINNVGDIVFDGGYLDARDFSGGFARVSCDAVFALRKESFDCYIELIGSYGFIDMNGDLAIPPIYQFACDFSEEYAAVKVGIDWGYIDKSGRLAIPPVYSYASTFSQGLACVKNNGLYGYIDQRGNEAIQLKYHKAFDFSEGFAAVRHDGAWGFISTDGFWAINPTFEDVSPFREGLARARSFGKFGYISQSGEWVISPLYDEATSFSEGLALVQQGKRRSYIDTRGEAVFVVQ